jgi:hypothetical protein
MSETDTRDSLPSDTPSGQDPRGHTDDTPSSTGGGADAPDPRDVKAQGAGSAAEKDPAHWVTGDEPMTGPQASYLETLARQAGVEPPTGLNKSEASRAIDELQGKAGKQGG